MIAIATYNNQALIQERIKGRGEGGRLRFQNGSSIEHCLAAETKAEAGGVLVHIASLHIVREGTPNMLSLGVWGHAP